MTVYAASIPADHTSPITTVELPEGFDSLYTVIGCDLVEAVRVDSETTLWCDEEALCKAEPKLNIRASLICGHNIFGNAVLCGDEDGAVVSLLMPCPKVFFDAVQKEAERIVSSDAYKAAMQGRA